MATYRRSKHKAFADSRGYWIMSLSRSRTWSGLALDNCSCPTLFADDVCLSSAILVEPTSIKTIPELFRPAFRVLQRTGDIESVDPDKPG